MSASLVLWVLGVLAVPAVPLVLLCALRAGRREDDLDRKYRKERGR